MIDTIIKFNKSELSKLSQKEKKRTKLIKSPHFGEIYHIFFFDNIQFGLNNLETYPDIIKCRFYAYNATTQEELYNEANKNRKSFLSFLKENKIEYEEEND